MEVKRICAAYWSATGNTDKTVNTIAEALAKKLDVPLERRSFPRPAERAADLFRSPWLREQMQNTSGVLTRRTEERRYVALPYDAMRPFPLPALFCLARICRIGGRDYVVYAFDKGERPVL